LTRCHRIICAGTARICFSPKFTDMFWKRPPGDEDYLARTNVQETDFDLSCE
jgi:hypothetical protein